MPVFALSMPMKILIALTAALLLLGYGIYLGDEWAEGRHAKKDLVSEQAYSKSLLEGIERQRKLHAKVSHELGEEKDARAARELEFKRRLKNAPRETLVDVEGCRDQPPRVIANDGTTTTPPLATERDSRPRVRLSVAACKLWNTGLSTALTKVDRPFGSDGEDPCAAPVEIEDAIEHVEVVASLLGECRAREQSAQRWYVEEGLTQ